MIEVKNINKSFDDRQVLFDISATFDKGKTNLIIGQSGSGKTVLLKSIIGLRTPETGEVLYDGRNSLTMNARQMKELRKEIGMLFQGAALFDSETVLGNVMYPLRMHTNMTYRECKQRAEFCLERVNLHGANNLFPSEISGGMQKRVAIARAIALNPKYLFCDEPNSGLDPTTSIVIDRLIQEITQEYNITTVINTHDMNSVMEIGDKIGFIYKGNKLWEGSNKEILHSDCPELNDFVFASQMAKQLKALMK